tara:strand:+ start:243608 stop:244648 length:1041 start_codon:yes stop_codon:yes gene_type:complete
MPSLLKRGADLANARIQLDKLQSLDTDLIPHFGEKLKTSGLLPLKPTGVDILQINMGKMCNQICKHCHVDAGPDRKEIMTRETLQQCLDALDNSGIKTVDLTGGAPEMNPEFRWFVEEVRKRGVHVMNRCNLTIVLANPKYNDLPLFFKEHQVEVISSMPHYTSGMTDRQRGNGVFDKSIRALQMLNEIGYGKEGSDLKLNLVYNPAGAFLPGDQNSLEMEFKNRLKKDFNIEFNQLFCITNMPISRFLEYLIESDNYEDYMKTLVDAYNPTAAAGVMCRSLVSVGWDGKLYDCDFNQMLDMELKENINHISKFDVEKIKERTILINQHCYGCTAGAGSSCGGETA